MSRDIVPEMVLDEIGESVAPAPKQHSPFVGFAAGILSGWTKLIVGHPFDTIKVSPTSLLRCPLSSSHLFPLFLLPLSPHVLRLGASSSR